MAKLLRAAFPFMLHDLDRIPFDPGTGLPTNLGGPDAAA